MDNKLSELSKPVAEVVSKFGDPEAFGEREIKLLTCIQQMAYSTKFYSQEYVSALLAELEAKDKRIAELEVIRADASLVFSEIGTELGCNPDNESIMMAIDDLKATQMTGPLKDVLKRNIELEAKTAMTMGVGSGNGNLFVHGDYDSIKAAQAIVLENQSLRAKLATPVRLLGEMLPHEWERAERQASFEHRKIAWDARLAEDKKAILAAGFTFTVEGDE
ncbi:hypothetical protein [Serratia sp. (in: enterobacteria)]|uniref:hypothetical protein n=1 Tax=Serratia sp. (in: enterobacteria) TaxID=616 RepID=UPI002897F001|nr:hypothetical protein [Serratia sp. (in: enterobacteria)]